MSTLFRIIKIIIFLFILLGLMIGFLPSILSTNWGKNLLVEKVNQFIPGRIEVDALELSWWSGQKVNNFSLKDVDGKEVLKGEKFVTETSLWKIINRKNLLNSSQIIQLNAVIEANDLGITSIERALGYSFTVTEKFSHPSSRIILSDVNMNLERSQSDSHVSFFTNGKTVQEDLKGSFEIRLNLNKWDQIDWDHLQAHPEDILDTKANKNSDLFIHVSNFPTEVIDQLIAIKNNKWKGSIRAILGDRLSVFLEKLPNPNDVVFKLTAETPALTGGVVGKFDGQIIKLLEPAYFNLNLNSEKMNPYLKDYDLELLDSLNMRLALKSFSFPFIKSDNQVTSCDFGFDLQMGILKGISIKHKILGEVFIKDLKLDSLALLCESKIETLFDVQAIHHGHPFNISVQSIAQKPRFFNSIFEEIKNNSHLILSIKQLPLSLIPFFNEHANYQNYVGSAADFQATIKRETANSHQWLMSFSFDTGNLLAKDVVLKISDQMSLDNSLKLQWKFLPPHDHSQLGAVNPIMIEVNQFNLLWSEKGIEKLQLESKISEAQFSLEKISENLKIENFEIKIDGKDNVYASNIFGKLSLITRKGDFSSLLDHSVELKSSLTFRLESNQTVSVLQSKTELTNAATSAEFEGSYIDQKLTLSKPLLISYPLTPIAQRLIEEYTGQQFPRIEQTTQVSLRIEPMVLDLAVPSPITKLQAKGVLSFDHIKLEDPTDKLPVLEEIELPWMINALNNEFSINLEGLAYAKSGLKPGYLTASLQVSNWIKDHVYDISSMKIEVNADLTGLPTAVASTLLVNEDLTSVFGPVLDIDFSTLIDREQQTPGYVDLKLDSANFHVKGRFKLDDSFELFSAHKPAEVRFKVTPEAFLLLKNKFDLFDDLILSDSVTVSGNVSQLNLPLDPKLFKRGVIEAKLTTSFIQWHDMNSIPFTLRGVIRSENINNKVYFSFSAKSQKEAPIKIKGTIGNFFDNEGHMNEWDQMYLDSEIIGEKITPQFLKSLLFLKEETESNLQVLLGKKFNINASCRLQNLSGPIQAVISSEQTNAQLRGKLEHGNLFLTAPFEYKTRLNSSFNKAPFTNSIPFTKYILESSDEAYFKIYPEKFLCQLVPFNLNSLSIDKGEINLGKVQFLNQGDVSKVLNIISPISSDRFEIWFTPLYFQLKNSVVNLNRTDFLVNHRYPLAIWGMWNFLNNKADLILGLPQYTLKYAFGIKNLDSVYVLPMVLKSKENKFALDKKSLLANVSSLIAQTQFGKSGQFLGQFIDQAKSQVPPPTTSPFPWEELLQNSQQQQEPVNQEQLEEREDSQKKKKSKKKNKFLKNLDSNKVVEKIKNQALKSVEDWINH